MAEVASELRRAKEQAEAKLLALPGVTGVDIGYKEVGGEPTDRLAIRVLVAQKKPKGRVAAGQRVPEEIDGHPTDVIERRFELHQLGASVPVESLAPAVDSRVYDPLRGGISIGPCRVVNGFVHAGTLGAIVIDNASNEYLALSSFHVMCVDEGSNPGDTMAQPSRVDGGTCPGDVIGTLRRHAFTESVDAAVADVVVGGAVTRSVTYEVAEIGALTGTGTASLGQAVRKRGRTTGLTFGTVDSLSLTVSLDYGDGIGRRTLTNQIGIKPDAAQNPAFTGKGDTGSVVVNDPREVVGLLVAGDDAGYGVASPMGQVLDALNVRLYTPGVGRLKVGAEVKEIKVEKDHKELKPEKDEKAEGFDKGLRGTAERGSEPMAAARRRAAFKPGEAKEPNKFENEELKLRKGEKPENDYKTYKDDKEYKDYKDGKDDKDYKEGKDGKDYKDFKDAKGERKEGKDEKAEKDEAKESKDLKGERKEGKDEKAEKGENKELKNEKLETKPEKDEKEGKTENKDSKELKDLEDRKASKDQKDIGGEVPIFRSDRIATADPATVEERISSLEATVDRLRHFIDPSERPDLSRGALADEPDAAAERPSRTEDQPG